MLVHFFCEPAGFRMEHLLEFFNRLKATFDELGIVPQLEMPSGGGLAPALVH